MKTINKIAVVALLALASISAASAGTITILKVSGSTAYRNADVSAEAAYLNGLATGGVKAVYFGSSLAGAANSIVYGPTDVSGNQTVFENVWNGSILGVESLAAAAPVNFPDATQTTYINEATAVTLGTGSTGTAASGGFSDTNTEVTVSGTAQIAFSDAYYSTCKTIIALSNSPKYTPAPSETDHIVGVVPFCWVSGKGSPTSLQGLQGASITTDVAKDLQGNGTVPLAFIDGNYTTDNHTLVYYLGRDIDSGTRATTATDSGFSNGAATLVQYFPYDNSTDATANTNTGVIGLDSNAGTTFTAIAKTYGFTNDGIQMAAGDYGYYSGGNLQVALDGTNSLSPTAYIIAALGISDSKNALAGGAYALKYNGYYFDPTLTAATDTLSANANKIYQGYYTFWGYEHAFSTNTANTAASGIETALNGGLDEISSAGVTKTSMLVSRSSDGSAITPIAGTY